MARKHFLLVLVFTLILMPLALTERITAIESALAQALSGSGSAASAPSNIRNTRHNLSSSAPSRQSTSKNSLTTEAVITPDAAQTQEICVYCHTPHGATTSPGTPLWNRALNNTTYTPYSSSSLQATDLDVTSAALAAPSKLCLSCHDGTIAIGSVINTPGSGTTGSISLVNTGPAGKMPYGRGAANADHGFTRNLGTDLRNDHPISFTYNSALASADGELRNPAGSTEPTIIADRSVGVKPQFPLTGGKVQCTTCHDPHKETQKFLRKNRFQQGAPEAVQANFNDWSFDDNRDQICLGCHTRLGKAWAQSAHANSTVANETYKTADAALRDFPTGTKVWQAGCLNCHDTHTVGGSRRLLREGVSAGTATASPGSVGFSARYRIGAGGAADYVTTSATENTCYQCHTTSANAVITPTTLSATEGVPNIEGEFARTYRMPISTGEQGLAGGNSSEVHDITDKDGMESSTKLGYLAKENRHVECTDCHNPHRVVRGDTFLGGNLAGGDTNRRTHVPNRGTTGNQGNIASGVLRGTWGVEPSYTASGQSTVTASSVWMSVAETPTFTVKKGDPGAASTLPVGTAGTNAVSYLTREYQLCFKCHSNYGIGPNDSDFADLRPAGYGGTPIGTDLANQMTRYTNVAKEFAVIATDPATSGTHQGEAGGDGTLTPIGSTWDSNTPSASTVNHRAWHPVIFPTGRNRSERRMSASGDINMQPPWAAKMGTQTMHCSDCHGHSDSAGNGSYAWRVGPRLNEVQGPHGSASPFILKGVWNQTLNVSASGVDAGKLCGNCHNPRASSGTGNGHSWSEMGSIDCMNCHVAVPHGWKNKAFLVNRACLGREAGESNDCTNLSGWNSFWRPPYYVSAAQRISTWVASGSWTGMTNCGGGGMDACNN